MTLLYILDSEVSFAPGFVCDSRAKCYTIIQPGIKHHLILVVQAPIPASVRSSNDCLPVWNFGTIVYCTQRIHWNTTHGAPCVFPIEFIVRCPALWRCVLPEFFPLVAFIGRWRSRRKDDDLIMVTWSRENEHFNERGQPLRKGSQDREDSLGFRYQHFSPLTPPLKISGRDFLWWRRIVTPG